MLSETEIVSTHHFVDSASARKFYAAFGKDKWEVRDKIAKREILIGQPPCKEGETLIRINNGWRYAIKKV